jgi:iron complex outermembrane recepter protein
MPKHTSVRQAVRLALLFGAVPVGFVASVAVAQDQDADKDITEIVVTGTRITQPGVESSSPIYSVGAGELEKLGEPDVEKVFRSLPSTLPSDGQNVNNGTAGAETLNLRGLGAQRNLLMIDGKRITPYDINGIVDTSVIPTALIERIDIITGGASAVYGSDAMSGVINFVMKKDFEGVALDTSFSQTTESDSKRKSAFLTMGTNVADGRGNVVLSLNWNERDGTQLGARPLGQLGIVTASAANYQNFLDGLLPTPPTAANCGGENAVAAGGSTTTIPTRVAIAGGPGIGQFRTDGTIGSNCSVFNFNPYNYYQTPQTRYGGTALGSFEINEHAEAYGRLSFTSTDVRQQIAPSGVFGNPFFTPLTNPFISASAQASIIAAGNTGVMAGTVSTTGALPNWRDNNNNNVVDAADDLLLSYRRRTVELGERSTSYAQDHWSFVFGLRGAFFDNWDYDLSFQRGESSRTNVSAGYTNVANIEEALDAVSTTECRSGNSACVPINLFGGEGTITPEMAAFAGATALEQRLYSQTLVSGSVSGAIEQVKLPWAENSLAISLGAEYREEEGETRPDECLKLAPSSCLGGAGGNTLPIKGGFDVREMFAEAILPIVSDKTFFKGLDLELGYRFSDYDPSGSNRTWKYGLNWQPIDSLRLRGMKQRAARAPNVGELAAPLTSSLFNASVDPCSRGNPTVVDFIDNVITAFTAQNPMATQAQIDAAVEASNPGQAITGVLRQRCVANGQSNAQVGNVEDIVVGQINAFSGTRQDLLPTPEVADTTTFGFVWTPDTDGVIRNPIVSVDYYDIKIDQFISTFGADEVLVGCFERGSAEQCAKVRRVGGGLTLPGSGVVLLTENLVYLQAEGIELNGSFGVDIGDAGKLTFSASINKYLTQESLSSTELDVIDCKGRFGNQCGNPLPEVRWIQRTTWEKGPYEVSLLWRHLGEVEVEPVQYVQTFEFISPAGVAEPFRKIDAYNYFDLTAAWDVRDNITVRAGMTNIFDKDPPVVGNEAGTTASNSGNTFPSVYDPLGRRYSVSFNVKF